MFFFINGVENSLKYLTIFLFSFYLTAKEKNKYVLYVLSNLLNVDLQILDEYRQLWSEEVNCKERFMKTSFLIIYAGNVLKVPPFTNETKMSYRIMLCSFNDTTHRQLIECLNNIYNSLKDNIIDKRIFLINLLKLCNDYDVLIKDTL